MAINLGGFERRVQDTFKVVTNTTKEVIENTVDDIDFILRRIGDCARAIDQIRVRVANRTIEYQTAAARILMDTQVWPVELIDRVYRMIARQVERDPEPTIYRLPNPRDSVWLNADPHMVVVNPNTHNFRANVWPYIFIHGAFKSANRVTAFSLYNDFEIAARMFEPISQNSPDYRANTEIYLVSYDSQILGEDELIIRKAFATVLGQTVTGSAPTLFLAVMWRELERRATVTADRVLLPFFNRMSGQQFRNSGLISHSLGCFVAAQASNRFILQPNAQSIFQFWFCMAAALPANAFTNTGAFKEAPRIAGVADEIRFGTSVWFSYIDAVLIAYDLANNHLALGQTGVLTSVFPVTNFDVSLIVGATHEASLDPFDRSKTYFQLLSPNLREALFTEDTGARISGYSLKKKKNTTRQKQKKQRLHNKPKKKSRISQEE